MKKLFFFILMILFSHYTYSQGTVAMPGKGLIITKFKMNNNRNETVENILFRNSISKNNLSLNFDSNPPFIPAGKKQYTYNNNLITEREMFAIMLEKNNPELNVLVKKAKFSRRMQYAGFAVVPLLAFTVTALIASSIAANNIDPGTAGFYRTESAVGGVAVIVLGFTGIAFTIRHTQDKEKAVNLYNQNY